jgi:DNA-binding CsgD family transcriptional regulator/tetratricopeptide (TPR) repeat protein
LTWVGRGWWATRVVGSTPFVGRDRELSRLRAVVGGAERLLLVMGDAGVGKTRLLTEGIRRMAADGVVAVTGGCLPMRETLPLLPVADALGELYQVDGGHMLEGALAMTPEYVRVEVERLLPQLRSGGTGSIAGASGQRDRLFAAVAELLGAVAQRRSIVLVVEDVHWADAETLDCVTFLTRARRDSVLTVVVTCRGDETPLEPQVAEWLTHVRGIAGVAEVRLGPLTRDEVAEQVAGLAGSPASAPVVDELYARTEGNPFFTEQLVAAAAPGVLGVGVGLPARLAELLVTRAARCGGAARTMLSGLAVAGRPLREDVLGAVSGLDVDGVRGGLRELAAARLLADTNVGGEHRPRHALLAEAVAAELLPGERVAFHERVATALQAVSDDTSAAEIAGHWAAASRAAEELPARVRAAEAAERVFGYAEAARHWQRAVELSAQVPGSEQLAGMDQPHLYLRGLDALVAVGDAAGGRVFAEEAYRRFADHPDPAVAAAVHLRAARFRWDRPPEAQRPLYEQALRLLERVPPSVDHAKAWFSYAGFLIFAEGREDARRAALTRGLEVAEAVGATAVAANIQINLAHDACLRGQVAEGFALAQRARALAEASGDGDALVEVAADESDMLLKTGQFDEAAEAGRRGVRAGRESGHEADIPAANAAEAMLARGRTTDAAELIDPLTDALPLDADHFPVHGLRAEIDLLRGDVEAAAGRLRQIRAVVGRIGNIDNAGEIAQLTAEVATWAGRPADGLAEVRDALARYQATDWTIQCGWLLVMGIRACADLAGQGRARRDKSATQAAVAAADDLVAWVDRTGGTPFTDHPYMATIPATRANWNAERTRLSGASNPAAWQAAADAWDTLGCPHRAAYAWWRGAEARLLAGEPPASATNTIQAAAAAAAGHAPLLAAIRALADRARIPLATVPAAALQWTGEATPYGLTDRELLVLRLLVAGRSNGEIGAELFISRKTASVHVSNILRKLGVSTRVQAAALAERAGLVRTS